MKFTQLATLCFALSMCISLVAAQFFGHGFGSSAGSINSIPGSFGGPSGFAGAAVGGRDPRDNRGPVVFPPSPPDAPEESSGVIIGGSGFGFVPPQQQSSGRIFGGFNPSANSIPRSFGSRFNFGRFF